MKTYCKYKFILLIALAFGCSEAPKRITLEGAAAPSTAADAKGQNGAPAQTSKEVLAGVMDDAFDCTGTASTGVAKLRLLTREEFQNTIRDVLQVKTDYRSLLPTDIEVQGFQNNAETGKVSDTHVESYLNAAIKIVDEIKPNLRTLLQCSATAQDDVCAGMIIEKLAPLLWRRPLTASEKTSLQSFYTAAVKDSAAQATNSLITRLLISPMFLYRSEVGESGTLTSYELANALSYFFWGTVPDAELLALAKAGTLGNDANLTAQALRLMSSPKSKYAIKEFAAAWLGYRKIFSGAKSAALFPKYTTEIQNEMAAEAENTFHHLLTDEKSVFADLFTRDYSIGSAKLATFYKAKPIKVGVLDAISFSDTPRRGVLGLGALLSHTSSGTETNPFRRGDFVLQNMLCHVNPPTPVGLVIVPPPPDPTLSTRERFTQHSASPACKGCHILMDGVGFGMEDFDAVGVYRPTDNGKPVDSSGTLIGFDKADAPFNGVGGLSTALAESRSAKRCFVTQWYRLAHGHMEKKNDICPIRDLADRFEKGELSMPQLIVKMITHPSFLKRGP